MNLEFKRAVLKSFEASLEQQRSMSEHELATLDEAAANETKSSAGDKYETAREMFSQARDLQRRLREEAEAGLAWIARLDLSTMRTTCAPGALVETSRGWLLLGPLPLSTQVGELGVQGMSLQSPLGLALKGATTGAKPIFRDQVIEILQIL